MLFLAHLWFIFTLLWYFHTYTLFHLIIFSKYNYLNYLIQLGKQNDLMKSVNYSMKLYDCLFPYYLLILMILNLDLILSLYINIYQYLDLIISRHFKIYQILYLILSWIFNFYQHLDQYLNFTKMNTFFIINFEFY